MQLELNVSSAVAEESDVPKSAEGGGAVQLQSGECVTVPPPPSSSKGGGGVNSSQFVSSCWNFIYQSDELVKLLSSMVCFEQMSPSSH